jgi:hypothetical protein
MVIGLFLFVGTFMVSTVNAAGPSLNVIPVTKYCTAKQPIMISDVRAMLPQNLKDLYRGPQMSVYLTGPTMPPDPWAGCGADPCNCLINSGWQYFWCTIGVTSPPSGCTGNSC